MADNGKNKGSNVSPLKVGLIVVGVLMLEGAIIGATMWLSSPSDAQADSSSAGNGAAAEVQELLVVHDKFPNLRTGRQILYDMEVYVTVAEAANEEDRIKNQLESRRAQIVMEIGTIVRSAEPAYFQEPTLSTLRRQIETVLDERLGRDEQGESVVEDVLITRCTPFRADF